MGGRRWRENGMRPGGIGPAAVGTRQLRKVPAAAGKGKGRRVAGQKKAGPPEGPCLFTYRRYDDAALVLFPPAGNPGESGKTGAEQQHRGGFGDGGGFDQIILHTTRT